MTNTATRIIVALLAMPLIIFLILQGGWWFFGFIQIVSVLALHEYYAMASAKSASPNRVVGLFAGFFSGFLFFFGTQPSTQTIGFYPNFFSASAIFLFFVSAVLTVELWRARANPIINAAVSVFGVAYISLSFGSLIALRSIFFAQWLNLSPLGISPSEQVINANAWGATLVLTVFSAIWICDSVAFFIGKSFGKHKLFPRVSPKKSWEGAIAGFIASSIAFVLMTRYFLPCIPPIHAAILGALIGIAGQVGDLAESLLKRDAEIKDSSNIIPGHGGIFDRFDSIIFVSPVVYIYLGILFAAL